MEQIIKNREPSILNNRLGKLMADKKLTIQTLAQKAGIAVGTVQKLTTDPTCNPTISSLEAICKVLGISISYLMGQQEHIDKLSNPPIPLLNWETLVSDVFNLEIIGSQRIQEGYFVNANYHANTAFALKMLGNSMLPIFPEGSTLIFDKNKRPYDSGYTLIYIDQLKKILFKQLLIDEPNLFFKSCNPTFKDNITPLSEKDRIIAMLVISQMEY